MKLLREIIGYVLGGVLFVGLIPTLMWLASGMPDLLPIDAARGVIAAVVMLAGLALSVWTIIYMKRRGKGNPMDAFGHEVAPRTSRCLRARSFILLVRWYGCGVGRPCLYLPFSLQS